MESYSPIIIFLISILVLWGLLVLSNKNNQIKNSTTTNSSLFSSIKHPNVKPTFLQLYPDENLGVYKFIGRPEGQPNQLLGSQGEDRAEEMGLNSPKATYASLSFDMEKDGYSDLICCMKDGIWIYKNNLANGKPFSCLQIYHLDPNDHIVPNGLVIHDFDRDGNFDIYVRLFKQNQLTGGLTEIDPVVLRSNGPYEFVDISCQLGTMQMRHILQKGLTGCDGKGTYLSDQPSGHDLIVKLPNTVDFVSCRVAVIAGLNTLVKYNLVGNNLVQNGTLVFNIPGKHIDMVKVRTIFGKDYNYDQQKVNSVLHVNPIVHFDSSRNLWRSTSMG